MYPQPSQHAFPTKALSVPEAASFGLEPNATQARARLLYEVSAQVEITLTTDTDFHLHRNAVLPVSAVG